MTRPSRHEVLMRQAQIVAERSTCSRAHVGAVIAHDGRVVAQGYNGAPAGMPHCSHECKCELLPDEDDEHAVWCPMGTPSPRHCKISVHAEVNAIAFAAKHGVATAGAVLFTTMAPCLPCSQLIINAGIIGVVYSKPYRYDEGIMLMMDAGLSVVMGVE